MNFISLVFHHILFMFVLGPIWATTEYFLVCGHLSLWGVLWQSWGALADTVLWRRMLGLSALCFLLTSLNVNINDLEQAVWTWSLYREVTVIPFPYSDLWDQVTIHSLPSESLGGGHTYLPEEKYLYIYIICRVAGCLDKIDFQINRD